MADCVVCSYPLIHVANGNLVGFEMSDEPEARDVMKKHNIDFKEGETPVGCYVCPECASCVWLEE